MDDTGFAASYYAASAHGAAPWPTLQAEVQADVCIMGAGYTGLSTALHLREQGHSVVVLEAARVAQGASGRNGGQVCVGLNLGQSELETWLGAEHAQQLWELSVEALALVKDLIARHKIHCDLKDGILHTAFKPSHVGPMQREAEHLQQHYGYQGVRFVARDELRSMLGTERYQGAQLFADALHLHPLNYALGLAEAARAKGVHIFENSRALGYQKKSSNSAGTGKYSWVKTAQGTVRAKTLVLACNGYLGALEPRIAGKIMPINNFILATEPLGKDHARSLIRDDVAVADSKFVVNYFRLTQDNRLLFGGGENYSSRFPADIPAFVRRHLLQVYPQLESTRIDYAWGGTLAITRNRMPFFRRLDSNLYVAQGYSGHGIALATLGGKLISDAISGSSQGFDILAAVPSPGFPGGTLLRWPALVAGMLYYQLRDRLS
ncbi:NAD(P)/FAD-dependent oxidoreductase [Marinobacterium sedimentorum]|uniref:NAD(P)/FAD-dependent oxidoreductase n=1 Tax=Marinobacterium sedimentorum TaxID=2927804 RepID=UPI0020C6C0F1|nr:FAD-binding oxidoreductase [Marinobacterium sedimentorum]MCP8688339.1 FAD-binding oxidoreductase [Marinobacterium sedimentorum]